MTHHDIVTVTVTMPVTGASKSGFRVPGRERASDPAGPKLNTVTIWKRAVS